MGGYTQETGGGLRGAAVCVRRGGHAGTVLRHRVVTRASVMSIRAVRIPCSTVRLTTRRSSRCVTCVLLAARAPASHLVQAPSRFLPSSAPPKRNMKSHPVVLKTADLERMKKVRGAHLRWSMLRRRAGLTAVSRATAARGAAASASGPCAGGAAQGHRRRGRGGAGEGRGGAGGSGTRARTQG